MAKVFPMGSHTPAVFDYIEVDQSSNQERHSANGHISPLAYETKIVPCTKVRYSRVRPKWFKRPLDISNYSRVLFFKGNTATYAKPR